MTANVLRQEVLKSFKNLHRTSTIIFKNNKFVLDSARNEINKEFKKNKNVSDIDAIKELIKFADDVTCELKNTVVEVEETAPGTFKLNLRPEMFEQSSNPSSNKQ